MLEALIVFLPSKIAHWALKRPLCSDEVLRNAGLTGAILHLSIKC